MRDQNCNKLLYKIYLSIDSMNRRISWSDYVQLLPKVNLKMWKCSWKNKQTNTFLWHLEDINRLGSQGLTDSSAFPQQKHLIFFHSSTHVESAENPLLPHESSSSRGPSLCMFGITGSCSKAGFVCPCMCFLWTSSKIWRTCKNKKQKKKQNAQINTFERVQMATHCDGEKKRFFSQSWVIEKGAVLPWILE